MIEFPPRDRPPGLLDGFLLRMRFLLNRRDIDAARRLAGRKCSPEGPRSAEEIEAVFSIYARAIRANANAISDLVFFLERFERRTGLKVADVLGLASGREPEGPAKRALAILGSVCEAARREDGEALAKGPNLIFILTGREMEREELRSWL